MATTDELKISVRIDANTKELEILNGKFNTLSDKLAQASKAQTDFSSKISNHIEKSIKDTAKLAVSILTIQKAYDAAAVSFTKSMDFGNKFAELTTLTHRQAGEYDNLKQKILDLNINASNLDITEALYQATSAGIAFDDSIGFVTDSYRLAKVGATDLTTSTNALTNTLNAYGVGADHANQFSQALFASVTNGKVRINELSENLGKVAPIAAQAGVKFEELTSAMAVLGNVGISVPEATTGIRAILSSILKPTDESAKSAKMLGIEWNSAGLKAKGFAGLLAELNDKTHGNQTAMVKIVPQQEAMSALFALSANHAQKLNDVLSTMPQWGGWFDQALSKMTTGKEAVGELSKSWDSLVVSIGDSTPMTNGITTLTTGLNAIRNNLDTIKTLGEHLIVLGVSFGAARGSMIAYNAVSALTSAQISGMTLRLGVMTGAVLRAETAFNVLKFSLKTFAPTAAFFMISEALLKIGESADKATTKLSKVKDTSNPVIDMTAETAQKVIDANTKGIKAAKERLKNEVGDVAERTKKSIENMKNQNIELKAKFKIVPDKGGENVDTDIMKFIQDKKDEIALLSATELQKSFVSLEIERRKDLENAKGNAEAKLDVEKIYNLKLAKLKEDEAKNNPIINTSILDAMSREIADAQSLKEAFSTNLESAIQDAFNLNFDFTNLTKSLGASLNNVFAKEAAISLINGKGLSEVSQSALLSGGVGLALSGVAMALQFLADESKKASEEVTAYYKALQEQSKALYDIQAKYASLSGDSMMSAYYNLLKAQNSVLPGTVGTLEDWISASQNLNLTTSDSITSWTELGNSLLDVATAQDAYNTAIQDTLTAQREYSSLMSTSSTNLTTAITSVINPFYDLTKALQDLATQGQDTIQKLNAKTMTTSQQYEYNISKYNQAKADYLAMFDENKNIKSGITSSQISSAYKSLNSLAESLGTSMSDMGYSTSLSALTADLGDLQGYLTTNTTTLNTEMETFANSILGTSNKTLSDLYSNGQSSLTTLRELLAAQTNISKATLQSVNYSDLSTLQKQTFQGYSGATTSSQAETMYTTLQNILSNPSTAVSAMTTSQLSTYRDTLTSMGLYSDDVRSAFQARARVAGGVTTYDKVGDLYVPWGQGIDQQIGVVAQQIMSLGAIKSASASLFDSSTKDEWTMPSGYYIGTSDGVTKGNKFTDPWGWFNKPQINGTEVDPDKLSIFKKNFTQGSAQYFADGGIVSRPTNAIIGEAGYPEAVIPLKRGNVPTIKLDTESTDEILKNVLDILTQEANQIKKLASAFDKIQKMGGFTVA